MFGELPDQWTPAVSLASLAREPFAFEVAGQRLVAFRGSAGEWRALLDRCPHRGAALSLGSAIGDGTLRCGYHGWRFDGAGHCVRVPLNDVPARALDALHATAIPTRTLAGMLWVYTGSVAESEPTLPESLRGSAEGFVTYEQEWRAHWTRAVENFIDFAHPPYLHRQTIGAYSHEFAERGGIASVEVRQTDFGMTTLNYFGDRRFGFRLDWYRPNLSVLHFGPEWKLHVFSIPIDAKRTRVMTVRRGAAADRAASIDHPILDEDRAIVESQHGPVPSSDGQEMSVGTDAASIAFRRWLETAVRKSDAESR